MADISKPPPIDPSHSTRVRGLKRTEIAEMRELIAVALYTGAWIETSNIQR
ncbi:MAG: hypothetical protein ACRCS7_10455 [Tannerellaceae bacterium]